MMGVPKITAVVDLLHFVAIISFRLLWHKIIQTIKITLINNKMKTQDKVIGMLIGIILINISITTILIAKSNNASNFVSSDKTSVDAYNLFIADDANVNIQVVKNGGDTNLQISFNGNEGSTGMFSIYNASNQLITEFQIDLKQVPNYASINLTEFASGTYTCNLTTSVTVNLSHFTIN